MSPSGTHLGQARVISRRRVAMLATLFTLAVVWGCTTPADLTPVNAITFQTSDSVLKGRTIQLHPSIVDVNGRPVTGHRVTYQALDANVATVDEQGLVTGLLAGTAFFRVSAGGVSVTTSVRVLEPVTRVVLSPQSNDVPVGQNRQLVATMTNASGQSVAGRITVWSSGNPTVAIVNSQGVVSAIAVGTAVINAGTDLDQVYGQATVTVGAGIIPIASITFNPSNDTLIPGDPKQYNPLVKDIAGTTVTSFTGRTVNWETSNQPVASVSQQAQGAVVTANLPGTAVITVTIDNVTSNSLQISVVQVAEIRVTPNPVTLTPAAKTQQLTVVLKDANDNTLTSTRPITYQSQSGLCVSVSSAGLVTGLYPATVTCPPSVVVTVSAGGVVQPVTINLN